MSDFTADAFDERGGAAAKFGVAAGPGLPGFADVVAGATGHGVECACELCGRLRERANRLARRALDEARRRLVAEVPTRAAAAAAAAVADVRRGALPEDAVGTFRRVFLRRPRRVRGCVHAGRWLRPVRVRRRRPQRRRPARARAPDRPRPRPHRTPRSREATP